MIGSTNGQINNAQGINALDSSQLIDIVMSTSGTTLPPIAYTIDKIAFFTKVGYRIGVYTLTCVDVGTSAATSKWDWNNTHFTNLSEFGVTLLEQPTLGAKLIVTFSYPATNELVNSQTLITALEGGIGVIANTLNQLVDQITLNADTLDAREESNDLRMREVKTAELRGNSSWTKVGDVWTQRVSVSGITATDKPIISVDLSSAGNWTTAKAMLKAWSLISYIETENGAIVCYCFKACPQTTINILIKGR